MIETPGCPGCGSREATPVSFTWWGGFVGPKLLSHVQCAQCGSGYNAKTGRSNSGAIAIYVIVILAVVAVAGVMMALERPS